MAPRVTSDRGHQNGTARLSTRRRQCGFILQRNLILETLPRVGPFPRFVETGPLQKL